MMRLAGISMMALALAACVNDGMDGAAGPRGADGTDGSDGSDGPAGPQGPGGPAGPQLAQAAVDTLSNASGANQVAAYLRASNGSLSRMGRFATGGAGTGAALGSQGALAFDATSGRFFAATAPSRCSGSIAAGD
jgi:hypothetical protein